MNKLPLIALLAAAPLWYGCGDSKKPAAPAPKAPEAAAPATAPTAAPEAAPAPASAEPAGETEPLKITFPPVEIVGTPVPIKLPGGHSFLNREAVAKLANTPILVPKGTKNLAKNKPVTSSDNNPIVGELSMVTDGDKEATEGYEVELASGPQWVQIDLEKTAGIYAIAVWHYHRQERAYKSVIIQISDDKEFKTGVTTVFNTDYANDLKFGAGKDEPYAETNHGRIVPVSGVKGRYVRLWSNGNSSTSGNHYIEVEVYGK